MFRPDAETLNFYANHPEIRPYIGGSGPLDLSAVTKEPNVALFGEHGGFCLSWTAPRTYEVHTLILSEGRGRWAIDHARASFAEMVRLGADHLWTRVHPDHRHVALFTRLMGFSECGTLETDFGDGPVAYRLFDWRLICQQQLSAA